MTSDQPQPSHAGRNRPARSLDELCRGADGPRGTPSARPVISDDELWDAFAQRALVRVAADGADFGEVLTAAAAAGDADPEAWFSAWTAMAERLAALASSCAAAGRAVSARQAWMRACTYLQVATFPLFGPQGDRRVRASFARQTETFKAAAALLPYPVIPVEIPLGGQAMQAYLCLPDDSGAACPTIVHTNGYDSTVHEMYFMHVPAAVQRGYNILIFDGPGQGRMLIRDGIPMRPDWESVVSPVVDWALNRPEVDPDRVVLAGWSFGGFLAPRAACYEHRIAALVADPGQWDQRDNLAGVLPAGQVARFPDGADRSALARFEEYLRSPGAPSGLRWRLLQRGLWVNGVSSLYDYLVDMTRYEISPLAGQIACPTLLTAADGDPISAGAAKLQAAIRPGLATVVRFTQAEGASGHCEAMARALYHQRVYDWLDATLELRPAPHRAGGAPPGRRDDPMTTSAPRGAGSPSRRHGLASRPSRTRKEVTTMTATRRSPLGQVMAAPRRAIRALRKANRELLRASEAIIRSARAPQPAPGGPRGRAS